MSVGTGVASRVALTNDPVLHTWLTARCATRESISYTVR
jgi:hypothetical protein